MAATPTTTQNYNYNPASAGGIVSTDPAKIAETVKAMQSQAVETATPVARAAEKARLTGAITPQQAETVKNFEKPAAPVIVSTTKPAIEDLTQKKSSLDTLSGSMLNQAGQKAAAEAAAAATPVPTEKPKEEGVDQTTDLLKAFGVEKPSETAKTQTDIELESTNKAIDDVSADWRKKMEQFRNGTFPLTADEQMQLDAMRRASMGTIEQARIAAQNYTSGVTQAMMRSGMAWISPTIALGNIKASIDTGLAKVSDLEAKASDSLAKARQSFVDHDYESFNKEYDRTMSYLKDRRDTLRDLKKETTDQENKMRDFAYKMQQDALENKLKAAEFGAKQSEQAFNELMASNKFGEDVKNNARNFLLQSDKFNWDKKMDMIKATGVDEKGNLTLDAKKTLAEIEKIKSTDTPASYKEWTLAGSPGSYYDYLTKKSKSGTPTADQSKAAAFAMNMKQSNDTIEALIPYMKGLSIAEFLTNEKLPTFMQSENFKRTSQAAHMFAEAWLRRTSGAAISEGEWRNTFNTYFPQAGDTPAVLDQKKRARQLLMENMAAEAGPAISDDFVSAVRDGKVSYYSLDDFARVNPTMTMPDGTKKDTSDFIGDFLKDNPGLSENDALQYAQHMLEAQGKSKPLSMGENGSIVDIKIGNTPIKVNSEISTRLADADRAFFSATGKHIQVNQSYRTKEQQEKLYNELSKKGARVAPPGKSFHEKGLAIDVTNWKDAEPFLRQYGLSNDLKDDKGHFSFGEFTSTT